MLKSAASSTSWTGAYVCEGGDLQLTIDLEVASGPGDAARPAQATLTYRPQGGGAAPLSTSTARGTLTGRDLALIIETGSGADYEVQGLNGLIGENADAMLGNVNAGRCSSFGLNLVD